MLLHSGKRLAGIGVRDGTFDLTYPCDSAFREKNNNLRAVFRTKARVNVAGIVVARNDKKIRVNDQSHESFQRLR